MRFHLLVLLLALTIFPCDSTADEPSTSLVDRPTERAHRQLILGDPERAVVVCRAFLNPDSSDAELRNIFGQAMVERDRICMPLPPNIPGFQRMTEGGRWCDMALIPPATRDTVLVELRRQAALAPNDVQSSLLVADFEARYGTREALRRELEGLAKFDQPVAREDIQTRLVGELSAIKRPATVGMIAEYLAGTDAVTLDCSETELIANSLVRVDKFDSALELLKRVSSKGQCKSELLPAKTMALMLAGRYKELWELTRFLPPDLDTINYYRYSLTAVLAAAHFDVLEARKRLAHERVNEEAYPPDARSLMSGVDSLLIDRKATAERWLDLSQRSFLTQDRIRDVRYLILTLALERDPKLEQARQALADDMVKREMPLLAARHFEALAGGRTPSLDRRWDPRRPRFLRQAAENYFVAEDDASCLALLALIPERTAEDELMAGVAALRAGDRATARDAFVRAQQHARMAAMVDVVGQLTELAGSASP